MPVSPQLPEASCGQDLRLNRLIRAGEAFYAARRRYHGYEGDDEHEEERLCEACSKARLAFAQACERFFVSQRPRTA